MKLIKKESSPKLLDDSNYIKPYDTFRFRCHSDLGCFNRCCRNLNLFLYPYDVIKLKNELGITSDQFIETHVEVVLREGNYFPDVLLRMADNEEQTCPFLTEKGCSVYSGRPDACRTFPVEQGLRFDDKGNPEPVYFFKPPDFCEGRHEKVEWTPSGWASDQGAEMYNKMTVLWAGVKGLFQDDPWGSEGPNGQKGKMAFMAAYNVDAFRQFVFESSFLSRYKLKSDLKKKLQKDDVVLMRFGFDWIRFFIFGIKSKQIRLK